MLQTFLQKVTPFHLLTPEQGNALLAQGEELNFAKGDILLRHKMRNEDDLLLLLNGSVEIILRGEKKRQVHAPIYLGERAMFFQQSHGATVKAIADVTCLRVPGETIRQLMSENKSFSHGFAAVLKDKHRIFKHFEHFTARLMALKKQKSFHMNAVLEHYQILKPLLHKGSQTSAIDFAALQYVLARLPAEITSAQTLVLTEDPPAMYHDVMQAMQIRPSRGEKKRYYTIMPGKILCLLRDSYTDYLDVMTKLCVYATEADKIRKRLLAHDWAVTMLAKAYWGETAAKDDDAIFKQLPLSQQELKGLKKLFGNDVLKQLYHMVVQYGNLTMTLYESDVRYFALATEDWAHRLYQQFNERLSHAGEKKPVHLILSNNHSVVNSLSHWLQQQRQEIMQWAKQYLPDVQQLKNTDEQLYYATRHWLAAFPERMIERDEVERKQGIWRINKEHATGIEVQLIETEKATIVNIDYAYGRQALAIMRHLLLLFGHQIASISIFGKAGAVRGQRGDLLFPSHFLGQETEALYPLMNQDLSPLDFAKEMPANKLHEGMMLTVVGTLLQNQDMLHYYRQFNNMIGMEMEGAYYLHELTRAHQRGIIAKETPLRVCYYTSDLPLEEGVGLAQPLTAWEGTHSVYTITRVVLTKILGEHWHE